jgi:hypothetical protein
MLNKVTDYKILTSNKPNHLQVDVTTHLGSGWVPSGPLIAEDDMFLQVVVKFGK